MPLYSVSPDSSPDGSDSDLSFREDFPALRDIARYLLDTVEEPEESEVYWIVNEESSSRYRFSFWRDQHGDLYGEMEECPSLRSLFILSEGDPGIEVVRVPGDGDLAV